MVLARVHAGLHRGRSRITIRALPQARLRAGRLLDLGSIDRRTPRPMHRTLQVGECRIGKTHNGDSPENHRTSTQWIRPPVTQTEMQHPRIHRAGHRRHRERRRLLPGCRRVRGLRRPCRWQRRSLQQCRRLPHLPRRCPHRRVRFLWLRQASRRRTGCRQTQLAELYLSRISAKPPHCSCMTDWWHGDGALARTVNGDGAATGTTHGSRQQRKGVGVILLPPRTERRLQITGASHPTRLTMLTRSGNRRRTGG